MYTQSYITAIDGQLLYIEQILFSIKVVRLNFKKNDDGAK
jgi:hypothetical protein